MRKRKVFSGPAEARGAWGRQKGAQDTGQRVDGTTGNGSTESGSVAGSGAQPLLDNDNNNNNE